ncbi:MAG: hypothetical protein HN353_11830 [Bdellovibrionales bacterium]|nr:hypothetical protein [Bdellovibrionales bacterium]MBT3526839.1 hypothetical protein [Bdellovibrionales bacterium]MBT7668295.1 hypothetical protein [Bdellovibrionales bacterium]MBT7768214.1 hypothetical protein [Bdellovibrionales bacterium]
MTSEWAEELCEEWNYSEVLTENLDSWMDNNLERGYKVMMMSRSDCPTSELVQLTLKRVDGLTWCTAGGAGTANANPKADYIMTATTKNWLKMGSGEVGPAMAMITGRLKFKGPKGEAMRNMGPFKSFMLLIGAFESDASVCPQ